MTVELALAIVVGAAFACYLVWQWQGAAPIPPYQEPVEQTQPEPTALNPKAAWPFPSGDKP
jgi:hypothetical protein